MKIITIVGARPQFIKSAVLSKAFNDSSEFEEIIIHTGQHYDTNMSDIFFNELKIPKPKYNLNINSASHGAMTGRMLEDIENILIDEKPDGVLVYGDTNSTLAGALASKKINISVFHVESGLRSFNMKMPEEINRILTDNISDLLFCPSSVSINNLKNEGFINKACKFINVGDIMYESVKLFSDFKVNIPYDNYILTTIHRPENTDNENKLKNICNALNILSKTNLILFPIHPRTQNKLKEFNIKLSDKIIILPPKGYIEMLSMLDSSQLVLTDSGGLQKEAYFKNKYCVTVRDETEWRELVDEGVNIITGDNQNKILKAVEKFQNKKEILQKPIYGSGDTSKKIIIEMIDFFKQKKI
tara:strand:+ start:9286 stop:10359 length:1074 start_codon:yes stop_codon:yes gene_type:complete